MGKNNWEPIEANMIEWKYGQTNGDPAGDITHVSLTQPSMPAHIAMQHQPPPPPPMQLPFSSPAPQQMPYIHQSASMPERVIRPMPSRARLASAGPRSMSVNMDGQYTPQPQHTALFSGAPFTSHGSSYPYSAMPPSAMHTPQMQHQPMYGEDQVPMTVQMPMAPLPAQNQHLATPQPVSAMPSSLLSAAPPTSQINTSWMPEQQQQQQQHQGEPSPVDEVLASMEKNRASQENRDDEE